MLATPADRFQIRTPEGVLFSFTPATPLTRFLAWAIDLCCVTALMITFRIVIALLGIFSGDVASAAQTLAYFVFSIGYGICAEWYWRGQTIGKRVLRLRVIDARGLKLEPAQIVVRNLFRCLDMLPAFYAVGGIACFCTRRFQRLGDLVANTIVVRHPPVREPDFEQLASDKWNSLREHPHLVARLRQRVSPRLAALLLDAVLRRRSFEPDKRIIVFRELAAHLKELVPFPPETTESVTDEQYVRNVGDVIFRSRR